MNLSYISFLTIIASLTQIAPATEIHVSKTGKDGNPGSADSPLLTISAAAEKAQPGDTIIVHAGTYRERVSPPRGGTSPEARITYTAAPGEHVEIKGSEIVTEWKDEGNGVWSVSINNQLFGNFNPFAELIEGDWFEAEGKQHHRADVYLNGKSLFEAFSLEDVKNPKVVKNAINKEASKRTWFAEVGEKETKVWANFGGENPNAGLTEVNVREACFYPVKPGMNYITVRGFKMSQAATQWAPPTAEQLGLLGTHYSKGWIIEDNVISNSRCSGITLGKDRSSGHNIRLQNPKMKGYVAQNTTIDNAVKLGWNKDLVGHHLVRRNTIFDCEQTGICGHLGAIFSEITDNHIYNIWTKRQFHGFEIANIKIHAPVNTLISRNRVHGGKWGIWLDWMSQGTQVTCNLLYNNSDDDLFIEVNHGPYLVANNILLSKLSLRNMSQGGAFAHNLIVGKVGSIAVPDRFVPYFKPHTVEIVGRESIRPGDDRFYNNIFSSKQAKPDEKGNYRFGLGIYEKAINPSTAEGNVYLKGTIPFPKETLCYQSQFDPEIRLSEEKGEVYLHMQIDPGLISWEKKNRTVTTELLGKTLLSKAAWVNPDGSPLVIGTDYFGKPRDPNAPTPGPFEALGSDQVKMKVWPHP